MHRMHKIIRTRGCCTGSRLGRWCGGGLRIPRIARHQTPKTKSCASCASMFKKNIDPLRRPGRPPTPIEARNPPGSAGVPPASLFLMEVAERQRDFAGSHPVGVNLNGQTERDPRRPAGVPHRTGLSPGQSSGKSFLSSRLNVVYVHYKCIISTYKRSRSSFHIEKHGSWFGDMLIRKLRTWQCHTRLCPFLAGRTRSGDTDHASTSRCAGCDITLNVRWSRSSRRPPPSFQP